MNKELKPCPFCGREAEVIEVYMDDKKKYRVHCTEDDCPVVVLTFPFGTKEKAIEVWNTRNGEKNG